MSELKNLPPRRRSRRLMKKMGIMGSSAADNPNEEIKNWSDLPSEILSQIGDRLPLVELLGFRGVCKEWRLASSTASAECEYTSDQLPSFLIYSESSHCRLYNPSLDKVYTMNLPELDGATCIASKGGWLLMFRESSVFFFCPFSHAKIELPKFPHLAVSDYVAVFSSEPTARDCLVCIINLSNDTLEAYILKRGATEWGKFSKEGCHMKTVTAATLCNETFYFMESNRLMAFSLDKQEWCAYVVVTSRDKDHHKLPFERVLKYFDTERKAKLGLEDNDSLSICGTVLPSKGSFICIQNEDVIAKDKEEIRHKKGVLIYRRFFQLPPNQSWSL